MTFAHVWIGDERSERKDERTKDRRQIYGAVNDIIVSPMSVVRTGWMEWMSHRKRKETKQQPGTAGPGNILGCCLVNLHVL